MTINQIKNLKDNWDSYNCLAPNLISIQNSERFIGLAAALGFSVHYICVTSDESILIFVKDYRGIQEWDFYNDGDFAVMTVVDGKKKFLDMRTWKDIESVLGNYSL